VDVYEEEEDVFYQNLSEEVLHDDMLARLMVHAHLAVAHSQARGVNSSEKAPL
jgi:D-lactate dehydrogenase